METITINSSGKRSEILVGASFRSVAGMLPEKGTVILTDENVKKIYGSELPLFPLLTIKPGEESKRLEVIENLAVQLQDMGIDRSGFLLGIGGGVVCDITGFLSSIYLRGIRCGYVSTSLLSQVDASTGGKTGVNLGTTKNIIGTIRQPEFVICDPAMLLTLPKDEFLSGLAELIKTAIIGDRELFDLIDNSYDLIMKRDVSAMTHFVNRSVTFKAAVVTEDEFENGLRRILNFGHTLGHAIELQSGVKHGFAVAAGMEFAAMFSFANGYLTFSEKDAITGILRKFGLLGDYDIPAEQVKKLILHDKKKSGTDINFVFVEGIGKAATRKVTVDEITDYYKKFKDIKSGI